ncbi:TetR family transcriptional regulator [Streptomyces sp. NPDC057939]|uniref:TetR family transcriptional regulator n=1 Tax=Streptomyces sp. NPDC057939 TaxID=3346284 RepID=UPI0036E0FE90
MSEVPRRSRPKSDRAKWTYGKILDAAGRQFVQKGFGGATINGIIEDAKVTKGAFYFHFPSKETLAAAILESAFEVDGLVPRDMKLQELVDTGMILGHRISRDTKTMAALRLSLTHEARDAYGTPWPEWIRLTTDQLNQARRHGEIGSDVNAVEQAHQISGAWAGLVLTGHSIHGNLEGLEGRIATMYENLMTVIAHPRILLKIDFSPTRGRDLHQELLGRQC